MSVGSWSTGGNKVRYGDKDDGFPCGTVFMELEVPGGGKAWARVPQGYGRWLAYRETEEPPGEPDFNLTEQEKEFVKTWDKYWYRD